MQRLAELLTARPATRRARSPIALQAFNEDPLGEWAQETSRRLAGECGGWDKLVEAYEAALPRVRARSKDAKAVLPLLSTLAGAYESELGTPEAAIERNQAILAIAPSNQEAVGALERLYIATGRFPDLLAIYDKKLELAKSKSEELEIRFKLASLYEEEIKQPEKAIVLYQAILNAGRRAAAGADRARPHLHRPRPLEGAGGDADQGDRPHDGHGRDRRAEVPPRRAARAASRRSARARSNRTRTRCRWSRITRARRRRCRRT